MGAWSSAIQPARALFFVGQFFLGARSASRRPLVSCRASDKLWLTSGWQCSGVTAVAVEWQWVGSGSSAPGTEIRDQDTLGEFRQHGRLPQPVGAM